MILSFFTELVLNFETCSDLSSWQGERSFRRGWMVEWRLRRVWNNFRRCSSGTEEKGYETISGDSGGEEQYETIPNASVELKKKLFLKNRMASIRIKMSTTWLQTHLQKRIWKKFMTKSLWSSRGWLIYGLRSQGETIFHYRYWKSSSRVGKILFCFRRSDILLRASVLIYRQIPGFFTYSLHGCMIMLCMFDTTEIIQLEACHQFMQ